MKNKYKIYFKIIFFILCFNYSSLADEFELNSNNLKVRENGNILEASGDVEVFTNNNLMFKSDKTELNKDKLFLIAEGNVKINDNNEGIQIKASYVTYDKIKDIIFIKGKSQTELYGKFNLFSKDLYYDRKNKVIFSDFETKLTDDIDNKVSFKKFNLNLGSKITKVKNLKLEDNKKNVFYLKDAAINLGKNEIVGKEGRFYFEKSVFGNSENDPRIFGRSIISNEKETTIKKGVFTSCKLDKNQKCPPWLIKAEEVKHNKERKIVEYKNAWLNIYDTPVVYFPYFFHPDPTVKRQSGFLLPKLNNSNFLGSSIQVPYYNVISDNKDLTFTPRIFFNDKILLQSEYRQANKYSNIFVDHSVTKDDSSTINHLFGNFVTEFENTEIEFNLETTSNNNYLKKYNIKSPLIDSLSFLNSYVSYENSNEDYSFLTSVEVFEDLTKKTSDSYEYIYPNYEFSKNIKTNFDGSLKFDTSGFQKHYQTNKYDAIIVNNLTYSSAAKISSNGLSNEYFLILKNVNTDGNNSINYKNFFDNKLLTKIVMNTKYPLKKVDNNKITYLTPSFSARFSPTETKNIKDEDKQIDYFDLFNLNRINSNDTLEGGESITLGLNYKLLNSSNREILDFSTGQVFRLKENKDLPINSTLGQKRSDIVSNLEFSPNDLFSLNYSFSFDNDIKNTNYNFIETQFSINKFFTSFEFFEKNDNISQKSYISNTTKLNINERNSLGFSTNKNVDTNLTEYYDLIYEYKNDCLAAAIEYKKTYYQDSDILPDENIFFTVKILPFGKVSSLPVN